MRHTIRFGNGHDYFPIENDAQALNLVKRLKLSPIWNDKEYRWYVGNENILVTDCDGIDADLNRAICKCVANLTPPPVDDLEGE